MNRENLEAILPKNKTDHSMNCGISAINIRKCDCGISIFNKAREEILTALLEAGVGVVPDVERIVSKMTEHYATCDDQECLYCPICAHKSSVAIRALWLGEDK